MTAICICRITALGRVDEPSCPECHPMVIGIDPAAAVLAAEKSEIEDYLRSVYLPLESSVSRENFDWKLEGWRTERWDHDFDLEISER